MDAGVKTPQCAHLSSHFCISNTKINLIRILICRRFRSGQRDRDYTLAHAAAKGDKYKANCEW